MAEPTYKEFSDTAFRQESSEQDKQAASVGIATMFIATNVVFSKLPAGTPAVLKVDARQTMRRQGEDIKAGEDLAAKFSFKGYAESQVVDCIMSHVKDWLKSDFNVAEEAFSKFTAVSDAEVVGMLESVVPEVSAEASDVIPYIIEQSELTRMTTLLEETKMLGRLEDPKTVENLVFKNAQMISDMMGQFGNVETWKAGYLDIMKAAEGVLIFWITAGANTCDECESNASESPYQPEDYPDPPHYGCECVPGEPVPMTVDEAGEATFLG